MSSVSGFAAHRRTGVFPSSRPSFTEQRSSGTSLPKVVVIREELVNLTENPLIAVVLNQLLYWTERLPDFKLLIEEEENSEGESSHCHGWFYKTADELIEETLLHVSRPTMRGYLTFLIAKGWIEERTNPKNKWDKTIQYRVNLLSLHRELQFYGWGLSCFSENGGATPPFETDVTPPLKKQPKSRESKTLPSKERKEPFECEVTHSSNGKNLNFLYLTETTSKIINREHSPCEIKNQHDCKEKEKEKNENLENSNTDKETPKTESPQNAFDSDSSSITESMVQIWEELMENSFILTEKRKTQLSFLLKEHFQNDLNQWKAFCHRLLASPFLMGGGPRGWRVSLNWLLIEENLLKVLEGNFDDPNAVDRQKSQESQEKYMGEASSLLETIQDPTWKDWCTNFITAQESNADRIPLFILKDIRDHLKRCFCFSESPFSRNRD